MIKDIIFLGAGASRTEGDPLQADLFCDYFKMSNNKNYPLNIVTEKGSYRKGVRSAILTLDLLDLQ